MSYGKRVLTIDRHWPVLDDDIEATLVIETSRRWYRAGQVIGQALGRPLARTWHSGAPGPTISPGGITASAT